MSGSTFTARAQERQQEPIYSIIVMEDRMQLGADVSIAPSTISGAAGDSLVLRVRDGDAPYQPFMVYDSDSFELYLGSYDTGTNDVTVVGSAAYGTTDRSFLRERSTIAAPWMCFSTHAIPTAGGLFQTGMRFPSGSQQEFDLIEGYTRTQTVLVQIADTDGRITRELKNRTVIGKTVMVIGGYSGMHFRDFVTLHTGPVVGFKVAQGNVYELEIDFTLVKLKKKLFGDFGDLGGAKLTAGMTASQTTIPLSAAANALLYNHGLPGNYTATGKKLQLYDGDTTWETAFLSGAYFKVDSEYMLHTLNVSPPIISRGRLGSTATTHSINAKVSYVFVITGNPIDMLLGLLLTREGGYDPLKFVQYDTGGFPTSYYDFWQTVDANRKPLGLMMDLGDVDVPQIASVKEVFSRYVGRLAFPKETDIERELRENFFKALGTNIYASRFGKLRLFSLRPPSSGYVTTLDESSIIGVPELEFTSDDIINEVSVEWEYDPVANDPVNKTTVLDATSQSLYDRSGDCTISPRWLCEYYNGSSIAPRLGSAKARHFKAPNPAVNLRVGIDKAWIELGDSVLVSLPSLPDPVRGSIGWERACVVIGKKVDWSNGSISLSVVATAYAQKYFRIAPVSGVNTEYVDATDLERTLFGYIATASGVMSDGDEPYLIQ